MNYEQARQLGPESDAPGAWNWSNFNDGIANAPWTAWPCSYPDFVWPKDVDPLAIVSGSIVRTGRPRCDHATKEEAERHFYDATVRAINWRPIDQDTVSTLHRCAYPGCKNWGAFGAWSKGWQRGTYCAEHATASGYKSVHPFVAGLAEVHS